MTQVNLRTSIAITAMDIISDITTGKPEGLKFTGADNKVYEIFATPVGVKGVIVPETAPAAADGQAVGRVVYGGTEYVFTLLEADATSMVTIDATNYSFAQADEAFAKLAEDVKSLGTTGGDIDISGSI